MLLVDFFVIFFRPREEENRPVTQEKVPKIKKPPERLLSKKSHLAPREQLNPRETMEAKKQKEKTQKRRRRRLSSQEDRDQRTQNVVVLPQRSATRRKATARQKRGSVTRRNFR